MPSFRRIASFRRHVHCGRPAVLILASLISLAPQFVEPAQADDAARPAASLWNMEQLQHPPEADFGEPLPLTDPSAPDAKITLREVYYSGEPYEGKPTRVFAYYACPQGEGPFPAMVLVHGGGGTAFSVWAELWARRGYAALAMDLAGAGPERKKLPDGGPNQDDMAKFRDFTADTARDMWTYHAVAAVIRGHSLLASRKEVDADRIGVTGISWGGYLTCIVAGVDHRLKAAVPVYGCGFLQHNSTWLPRFARMSEAQRQRWNAYFDPSQYLAGVRCPILFVNGTNDFAYPLDSYQLSYRLVPGDRRLCIQVGMPHGHPQGWAPAEIGLFVDSVLREATPLARVGRLQHSSSDAERLEATFETKVPIVKAQLHYTHDREAWQQRKWQTMPAEIVGQRIQVRLPEGRPIVYFVTIQDERGAVVSSEHAELD